MAINTPFLQSQSQPPSPSRLLEDSLILKSTVGQIKNHLLWGTINVTAVAALSYKITNATVDDSFKSRMVYQGLTVFTVLLSINCCFHLIQYCIKSLTLKPISVTPKQRKHLGIGSNYKLVETLSVSSTMREVNSQQTFTATSPMSLSTTNWLFSALTENTNVGRNSLNDSCTAQWSPSLMDSETSPMSFGSFWKNSSSVSIETSPVLSRCAYQLSPLLPANTATASPSGAIIEETGPGSPAAVNNSEFWRRVKIDPACLTQWNANLRMWISLTILEPLVAELDHIDAAFVRCGLSDLHLGSVGLDRLKRTANIMQVVASIPSLPRLVLFLELSQHQEYLVTRIRELAKGGSMSEFRWNNGGSLHGKTWEEHLPTDAALVMHLIATYLDLQLVPAAQRPDGPLARPFSTQHFVRFPERPPIRPHAPIIHQTLLNQPHFLLVDKDETFDVPKGRNNMLHTFLLFIHLLKTTEYGMLGPLNLGRSGVNVLHVSQRINICGFWKAHWKLGSKIVISVNAGWLHYQIFRFRNILNNFMTLITLYKTSNFHQQSFSHKMKLVVYLMLLYRCQGSNGSSSVIQNRAVDGSNRTERTLFKKGAAFLAGYKFGSHFKDRPPLFGHGNLAATSSFNVLGKAVSSAFSFSYGDAHLSDPLYDPISVNDTKTRMQHVIVTTVDYPVLDMEAIQKLRQLAKVTANKENSGNVTGRINNRFRL